MRKLWVFALVLAGCTGDSDPHELGGCGDTWGPPISKCEAACEQKPDMTGPRCARSACTPNGDSCRSSEPTFGCDSTFTVDGITGCCAPASGPTALHVLFFECVE